MMRRIRFAAVAPGQDLPERCAALLVGIPPGAFFSHLTAAMLWPLPLPMPRADEPVHVGVPRTSRAPRRSGVVGHQVTDPLVEVVYRGGLPVVDPSRQQGSSPDPARCGVLAGDAGQAGDHGWRAARAPR